MHENRGDEQARAKVVVFFSVFDASVITTKMRPSETGRAPASV
jgi:hypothetical protein